MSMQEIQQIVDDAQARADYYVEESKLMLEDAKDAVSPSRTFGSISPALTTPPNWNTTGLEENPDTPTFNEVDFTPDAITEERPHLKDVPDPFQFFLDNPLPELDLTEQVFNAPQIPTSLNSFDNEIDRLGFDVDIPSFVQPQKPNELEDFSNAFDGIDTSIDIPKFVIPKKPNAIEDFSNELDGIDTNIEIPAFVDPQKPTGLSSFDEPLPVINTDFTFPELEDILNKINTGAPTFPTYAQPIKPELIQPEFVEGELVDNLTRPEDGESIIRRTYDNYFIKIKNSIETDIVNYLESYNPQYKAQMALLEQKIADYAKGGTALPVNVENAIYERARDKNNAEFKRVRDTAYKEGAKNGFTIPNGAILSTIIGARQAFADNNNRTANDIATKQAELEQANMQFALKLSADIRSQMMTAALNFIGNTIQASAQALDVAKSVLSSVIEIFNAETRLFNTKLDAYKARASIYETKLKAAMFVVDIYKAEIEAYTANINSNKLELEVYKSRVDILIAASDLYKSQIQTIIEKANIEKNKIQLFESKVKIKSLELDAKRLEWDGYKANISGQEVAISASSAKINAKRSELDIKKAIIDAKTDSKRLEWEGYKADISGQEASINASTAEISAIRAEIDIKKAMIDAKTESKRFEWEGYKADVSGQESVLSAKVAEINAKRAEIEIKKTVIDAKLDSKRFEWDGYKANISGQEALINARSSLLNAKRTEMELHKLKVEASVDAIKAIQTKNSYEVDLYKSYLQTYSFKVNTQGEVAKIKLDNERLKLSSFQAQVSAIASKNDRILKENEITAGITSKNNELSANTAIKSAELMISQNDAITKNSIGLAQVYSNTASSMAGNVLGMVSASSNG